jgi:hypothetical protein
MLNPQDTSTGLDVKIVYPKVENDTVSKGEIALKMPGLQTHLAKTSAAIIIPPRLTLILHSCPPERLFTELIFPPGKQASPLSATSPSGG